MATKPLKSWVDTLFDLMSHEELIIRKTPLQNLSITYKRHFNRDFHRQEEIVLSREDIERYGKSYVIKHVNQMIEEGRINV